MHIIQVKVRIMYDCFRHTTDSISICLKPHNVISKAGDGWGFFFCCQIPNNNYYITCLMIRIAGFNRLTIIITIIIIEKQLKRATHDSKTEIDRRRKIKKKS